MTTRPTRIAQTSTEVKKLYKNNGPALPEQQQRQLERAAELEERARQIREREERAKAAKKKREERERKEAAQRRFNAVGLATQLIGYSHTQAQLKNAMETFLGYKKKCEDERRKKEIEVAKQLEAVVEEAAKEPEAVVGESAKEPWDDDETFDIPALDTRAGDQWFDDDLDDDTLLELHDQILSDPVAETVEASKPPQPASSAPVTHLPKMVKPSKEGIDFVRLHGPANKMVDSILDKLPEPLIELLSQDSAIDPTCWNPSPALLYKLNPCGLPPHRLRVKAGCVVSLLRDLNSSSQLSKSQHLKILRVEQERLECLVLDGQLEGTKTFLTRVSFTAKHQDNDKLLFQRIQFPVNVSKDFGVPPDTWETYQSGFKKPMHPGRAMPPFNSSFKKVLAVTPQLRSQIERNPSFKLPGLPASKAKPTPLSKLAAPLPTSLDGWEDFFDSASQIARDLSSEPSSPCKQLMSPPQCKAQAVPSAALSHDLPPLSTQDFDFSSEDLDDSPGEQQQRAGTCDLRKKTREPLLDSGNLSTNSPSMDKHRPTGPAQMTKPGVINLVPPPRPSRLKRKLSNVSGTMSTNREDFAMSTTGHYGPPPKRIGTGLVRNNMGKPAPAKVASNVAVKRSASPSQFKQLPSFSEFGLSTQDAASFFDDDEDLVFGSPPIAA